MLQRWNPYGEMLSLRDAVDRLFQQSVVHPDLVTGNGHSSITLDIAEDANNYIVQATLPGFKPEEVTITLQGNTLFLQGERQQKDERKDQRWLVREQQTNRFSRSITLPMPITSDQVSAECENGVLTITLPKAEHAKPRQIHISGGQSKQLESGSASE